MVDIRIIEKYQRSVKEMVNDSFQGQSLSDIQQDFSCLFSTFTLISHPDLSILLSDC